jgi:FkbM family methyltransferase
MNKYGQEPEIRLLSLLMTRLENRTMIDVGAEHGEVVQGLLSSGVERVHAFDPHPDNIRTLRARFDGDARVSVHEYAVSDGDGSAELHLSSTADGSPLSFGHTLLERLDTPEITWRDTLEVARRSLGSLISSEEIPPRIGILKVDTEGHDLAVVRGMGPLDADVVMVEHWTDLPNGLGACPWEAQEMVATMRERGFGQFAFIVHRGEFVSLKWNDPSVEAGAMGNLVFLHDRVVDRLLPDLLFCGASLAEASVRTGEMYMRAAEERLTLIDQLTQAAAARLQALEAAAARLDAQAAELDLLKGEVQA